MNAPLIPSSGREEMEGNVLPPASPLSPFRPGVCSECGYMLPEHALTCSCYLPPHRRLALTDRILPIPGGGCHIWMGYIDPDGYGQFGRNEAAHRTVYRLEKGPIPEGLTIDHTCWNRCCVNSGHLEAVTQRENNHRARRNGFKVNAWKTTCPQGHDYTPENTYVENGRRHCRACNYVQKRESKLRGPVSATTCGDENGDLRCRRPQGHSGEHKSWDTYHGSTTWERREL